MPPFVRCAPRGPLLSAIARSAARTSEEVADIQVRALELGLPPGEASSPPLPQVSDFVPAAELLQAGGQLRLGVDDVLRRSRTIEVDDPGAESAYQLDVVAMRGVGVAVGGEESGRRVSRSGLVIG